MTDPTPMEALDAFESLPEAEAAASLGLRRGELRTRVFAAREAIAADHGLVFTGCRPTRAELAVAPDGVARRERLRRHVLACPGCAAWAEEVERQRDDRAGLPRGITPSTTRSPLRRSLSAVAVAAIAATAGYTGVGALQGGTPATPEAPVAAAADKPAPKQERKRTSRTERRATTPTTAASPAPVQASSLPAAQPQQAPAPQPTPERSAQARPGKPQKQHKPGKGPKKNR